MSNSYTRVFWNHCPRGLSQPQCWEPLPLLLKQRRVTAVQGRQHSSGWEMWTMQKGPRDWSCPGPSHFNNLIVIQPHFSWDWNFNFFRFFYSKHELENVKTYLPFVPSLRPTLSLRTFPLLSFYCQHEYFPMSTSGLVYHISCGYEIKNGSFIFGKASPVILIIIF